MTKQVCRCLVISFVLSLWMICGISQVRAFVARNGDDVTIAAEEVIDNDLYAAGETIVINGLINGDLWVAGRTVVINGAIKGSILAVAETITMTGRSDHTIRLACRNLDFSGHTDGDLMVMAAEMNISDTGQIMGDLLFVSGKSTVNGPVGSNMIGAGSDVLLKNHVIGNVKLRVKRLVLSPSADIAGSLFYSSENKADIPSGARILGSVTHKLPVVKVDYQHSQIRPFLKIIEKVMSFLMALITGFVLILIAPKRLTSISESIGKNPWPSLGWGTVILFATPPAAITIFFTIVGAPLALIAIALYLMVIYISQIPVGLYIGRWIIRRFFKVESKAIMAGALALGLFIIGFLRLIPFLGFWIGLAVILLGIGSVVVSEKQIRKASREYIASV